jgi:CheY-like chemotaxis protein
MATATKTQPILVVDDDPSIRGVVNDVLQLEGYSVCTAGNGLDALDAVERVRPALVLLDMRMPVMNGWGFARAMRARGQNIPILVFTAARDASLWAEEIGADGCIAKPFEVDELLTEVERLTTRH